MKRTSIRDVAKEVGVSITTVSRALNGYTDVSDETRRKIMQAAKKLNYAPDNNARALGGKSEITIGLLLSDLQTEDISNMVFGIISGVYHAAADLGCEFILLATDVERQTKQSFIQLCRSKGIDALVVMGLRDDDVYYNEMLQGEIPCALIDLNRRGKNLCTIMIDNIRASYEAVRYLVEIGHRHVGMINGSLAADVSKERYTGYAKALLDEGLLLNSEYLVYGDYSEDKAYDDTCGLLRKHEEITALFCASDVMALGAIRAINDLGKRVPEDISVIGFDDIPIARYVAGGISTIRQDPYQMGLIAGKSAYDLFMKKDMESLHKIVPHEFIIRNTTAEIRKMH